MVGTLVIDEVQKLIDQISDRDVLVSLACDLASHVTVLAPDPELASACIDAARSWRERPRRVEKALREMPWALIERQERPYAPLAAWWATIAAREALACTTPSLPVTGTTTIAAREALALEREGENPESPRRLQEAAGAAAWWAKQAASSPATEQSCQIDCIRSRSYPAR